MAEENMKIITRKDVIKILLMWQSGELSVAQVHQWAEELFSSHKTEYEDWEGHKDESVTNEVLAALDTLNMNLTTVEDVPLFLEFLKTPIGEFESGYRMFQDSLCRINITNRKEKLASEEFYSKYCV